MPRSRNPDTYDDPQLTQPPPPSPPAPTEDDPLAALMEALAADPERCEVILFRRAPGAPGGRASIVGTIAAVEFDPAAVGERWGGGTYTARMRDTARKVFIGRTATFEVAGGVGGGGGGGGGVGATIAAPSSPPPAPAQAAGDARLDAIAARLDALTAALAARPAAAAPEGLSIRDAVALMQQTRADALTLKDVLPLIQQRADRTPIGELLDGMRAIRAETGASGGAPGGASGGEAWAPVVERLLAVLAPDRSPGAPGAQPQTRALPAPAAPPPAMPAPATPPPASVASGGGGGGDSGGGEAAMREALALLRGTLRLSAPPDAAAWATVLADIAEAHGVDLGDDLDAIASTPGGWPAAVIAVAPDLEPRRAWLAEVETALRAMYDSSTGELAGRIDPAKGGGIDADPR